MIVHNNYLYSLSLPGNLYIYAFPITVDVSKKTVKLVTSGEPVKQIMYGGFQSFAIDVEGTVYALREQSKLWIMKSGGTDHADVRITNDGNIRWVSKVGIKNTADSNALYVAYTPMSGMNGQIIYKHDIFGYALRY